MYRMLQKLTATHLPLIVGRNHMEKGRDTLLAMISSEELTVGNVVWICNRQQGKTVTASQFIACLTLLSVQNAEKLAFIYSTSLSRSVELLNAVKRLIRWCETSKMPNGIDPPEVVRDIETAIVVQCCGLRNGAVARYICFDIDSMPSLTLFQGPRELRGIVVMLRGLALLMKQHLSRDGFGQSFCILFSKSRTERVY